MPIPLSVQCLHPGGSTITLRFGGRSGSGGHKTSVAIIANCGCHYVTVGPPVGMASLLPILIKSMTQCIKSTLVSSTYEATLVSSMSTPPSYKDTCTCSRNCVRFIRGLGLGTVLLVRGNRSSSIFGDLLEFQKRRGIVA